MVPGLRQIEGRKRRQRHPDLSPSRKPTEPLGKDTDDRVRHTVEADRAANESGVGAEPSYPETVAHDRERSGAWPGCFLGRERAPDFGAEAQHLEVRGLDQLSNDALG